MFENLTKVLRGAASIFVSGLDKDGKKPVAKPAPKPPAPPQA